MRKPAFLWLSMALTLLCALSACTKKDGPPERLSVAVSAFPLFDLTRRVAGPDADVALLKPSDAPSSARVGIMVGLGFDPWLEKLVTGPKARLVKMGDRVPTLVMRDDPNGDSTDPHVWLDPERVRLIVRTVAEELGRADGPHAFGYRSRATELDAMLTTLDKELETRTKVLASKGFVVGQPSLQYFADRYKLTFDPHLPTASTEPVDAMGGTPDTDTYEKMMRVIMSMLEKH